MLQRSAVCGSPLYANTGGPMSRTRKQNVRSTLLGRAQGAVCCPMNRSLGLLFEEGESALDVMDALLRSIGMDAPDGLRSLFVLPQKPLMARQTAGNEVRMCTVTGAPIAVLEQALWLGLCSAYLFDPGRPLVWTETSLRRSLELFEPVGFYV